MKTNAMLLAILLFGMSLAGCVSQSDGVAEVTLTDEQVDAIIEEHLDDILANMSIVVNEDITNHNNYSDSESSQMSEWFSSADTYDRTWFDGQNIVNSNGYVDQERCFEYGPSYDSQTGEYLGEECREYGTPNQESHWNVTNCTDLGGTPSWPTVGNAGAISYSRAPSCLDVPVLTIETSADEVLLIHHFFESMVPTQWSPASQFSIMTSCDNVSTSNNLNHLLSPQSRSTDYYIVPGSGMDCTHQLTRSMSFAIEAIDPGMYSLVYTIQDVTVV